MCKELNKELETTKVILTEETKESPLEKEAETHRERTEERTHSTVKTIDKIKDSLPNPPVNDPPPGETSKADLSAGKRVKASKKKEKSPDPPPELEKVTQVLQENLVEQESTVEITQEPLEKVKDPAPSTVLTPAEKNRQCIQGLGLAAKKPTFQRRRLTARQIKTMETQLTGLRGDNDANAVIAEYFAPLRQEQDHFIEEMDEAGFDYKEASKDPQEYQHGACKVVYTPASLQMTMRCLDSLERALDDPNFLEFLAQVYRHTTKNPQKMGHLTEGTPEEVKAVMEGKVVSDLISRKLIPALDYRSKGLAGDKGAFLAQVSSNVMYLETMRRNGDAPEAVAELLQRFEEIRTKLLAPGRADLLRRQAGGPQDEHNVDPEQEAPYRIQYTSCPVTANAHLRDYSHSESGDVVDTKKQLGHRISKGATVNLVHPVSYDPSGKWVKAFVGDTCGYIRASSVNLAAQEEPRELTRPYKYEITTDDSSIFFKLPSMGDDYEIVTEGGRQYLVTSYPPQLMRDQGVSTLIRLDAAVRDSYSPLQKKDASKLTNGEYNHALRFYAEGKVDMLRKQQEDAKKFFRDQDHFTSHDAIFTQQVLTGHETLVSQVHQDEEKTGEMVKSFTDAHGGFIVAESHDNQASKEWLIKHMETLVENGVNTIYIEHFRRGDHQELLDKFMETGEMEKPLESLVVNEKNKGLLELITAARAHKIRIIAADDISGAMRDTGDLPDDEVSMENRVVRMNHATKKIVDGDTGRGSGKYVMLLGEAHANTHEGKIRGIAGIGQLLHLPTVRPLLGDDGAPGMSYIKEDKTLRPGVASYKVIPEYQKLAEELRQKPLLHFDPATADTVMLKAIAYNKILEYRESGDKEKLRMWVGIFSQYTV